MRITFIVLVVAMAIVAVGGAGCGNVYLKGDALTAAETSTLDAYQAYQRAETQPAWQKAYLGENFKQWRYFVRSARKNLSWGPKLEGE
jgi:hypothetical protein